MTACAKAWGKENMVHPKVDTKLLSLGRQGHDGCVLCLFLCDQTTIPITSDTAFILFNAHHTCNHFTGEAPEVTTVRGLSRGYPDASFL